MIKIEITGNTIPELADKLLAIGASLQGTITMYDTPARKTPTKIDPVMPELREVAKAAPVDPTPAPKSAPVVEVSESPPTTAETSSTPADLASEDEELEVIDLPIAAIDFNADIRALALQLVSKRGKAALEKILVHFGVDRASKVEPARMPELLAMIKQGLGK
jgi:hypothetical protein